MSVYVDDPKKSGHGLDKLNAFTEELHQWSLGGKKPALASRELKYVLDCQRARLDARGLSMEQKIDHVEDEVTGELVRRGEGIDAKVVYRESVQQTVIRNSRKVLRKKKEPINIYATLLEKKGVRDFSCTCPNCGNTDLISKMEDGCPYCGTVFEIEDVWPRFTAWYSVPGIVERAKTVRNLKRYLTIIFICALVIMSFVTWHAHPDYDPIPRVIISPIVGAVTAGMIVVACYMIFSFRLMGRVFFEAGRAMPLLGGMKTKRKVDNLIKNYEPDFSYSYFEGRLVSLLRAIAFTDDRGGLSIYEGNEDLSFFDSVIDMQYRGSLKLLSFKVEDGVIRMQLKAYMTNLRYEDRLKRKDENYIVSIEKDIGAGADLGFSLCSVKCRNCGSSFDALHMKNCPYCGTPYKLVHDDWMITSIKRA